MAILNLPIEISIDSGLGKLTHIFPPLVCSSSFCGLTLTTTLTFDSAAAPGLVGDDDADPGEDSRRKEEDRATPTTLDDEEAMVLACSGGFSLLQSR